MSLRRRRLGPLLGTSLYALAALGCGDEAQTGPPDAPAADAPVDAGLDAGPLPPDLAACSADAPCPDGTDCVGVAWLGNARRCLRRCASTDGCGLDEICYVGVTDSRFLPMRNHCYTSLCFAALGPCRLGAEVGLAEGEERDGTCLPIDDTGLLAPPPVFDGGVDGASGDAALEDAGAVEDGGVSPGPPGPPGPIGQCLEAGGIAEDQPCDLQNRMRGGAVCAQGLVCAGGTDASMGRCARLCDPLAPLDPCAAIGQACFDDSTGQTLRDPLTGQVFAQIHGSWGYCRRGQRCRVTTRGSCPAGQGCLPTNPVHANGFCSVLGAGARSVGQSCVPFGAIAPSEAERCGEAYCDPTFAQPDAGPAGVCRAFCDTSHSCAAGSCVQYGWGDGVAGQPNLTQEFGVCR